MRRYVGICGENGIGERKKNFFLFFCGYNEGEDTPGTRPHPFGDGKSASPPALRAWQQVAFTHILFTLCVHVYMFDIFPHRSYSKVFASL
jgi:hypothetical protein